ncbi:MAG: HU family DNA-binding protein [Rhodobacteraceae bacterium]|jgi:DNA-binding protein HU-alpha|nr:HU family DNA-binding protein [Paracoccaceae bacterium]
MARKSSTKSKATSLPPGPDADVPAPEVVSDVKSVVTAPELKKKELLELVAERSGLRKNQIKPAVEAMMEILGEAIAEGRELNLEPLGKLKHQRAKETGNARVTVAKIRQNKSAGGKQDEETDTSDVTV